MKGIQSLNLLQNSDNSSRDKKSCDSSSSFLEMFEKVSVIIYLCFYLEKLSVESCDCDYLVSSRNGYGRQFNGIGAISGGGVNYPNTDII